MIGHKVLMGAAAGLVLFDLTARGGPPLLTDDPETPGSNHWEINIAGTTQYSDGEWIYGAPLLDLNYGVGERLQLKYQAQLNTLDPNDGGMRVGFGQSLVGVKWRFLDQTNGSWLAMSTYPQYEFAYPASSADRGLADGGNSVLLPIEVEHRFKSLTVYAEGGYVWNEKHGNEAFYGIALEHEFNEKFSLMGEFYGGFDADFQRSGLLFNIGFSRTLTEHIALIGAVGRGIYGSADRNPDFLSYLGLQFTY